MRQIYFLWPATDEEQAALIAELESARVDWILINNQPVDRRADMLFQNTNPLVFRYIRETYEPIQDPELPPGNALWKRRA